MLRSSIINNNIIKNKIHANSCIMLLFCSIISNNIYSQLDSATILSYYDTIVHYTEFTSNRWEKQLYEENIKLLIIGVKEDYLMKELNVILYDLNKLISPLTITITDDSLDNNMLLFIGERKDFRKICKEVDNINYKIRGYGVTYSIWRNTILKSKCFVETKGGNEKLKKHTLREEITQCLGFHNDTHQYKNSIFYQGYSIVNEFSELDKAIIRNHYK